MPDNLFGRDSTILVSRHLIIMTVGPVIVLFSASSIWQISLRTAIISIAANGIVRRIHFMYSPTGHGQDAKDSSHQSWSIPTILKPNSLSMAAAWDDSVNCRQQKLPLRCMTHWHCYAVTGSSGTTSNTSQARFRLLLMTLWDVPP